MTEKIFAVFGVAKLDGDLVAATTRAADRGESGRIGLPGGKIDAGESPQQALMREAAEEGWTFSGIGEEPILVQHVEGRLVHWYSVAQATMLTEYKEKGRIAPISATQRQILASGYGNDRIRF